MVNANARIPLLDGGISIGLDEILTAAADAANEANETTNDAVTALTTAFNQFAAGIASFISVNDLVQPFSGGGQASAPQLASGYTALYGAAADGDSVALPDAVTGTVCIVFSANNTHQTDIWPKNGTDDTINGVAAGDGHFALDAGDATPGIFYCFTDGTWLTNLGEA